MIFFLYITVVWYAHFNKWRAVLVSDKLNSSYPISTRVQSMEPFSPKIDKYVTTKTTNRSPDGKQNATRTEDTRLCPDTPPLLSKFTIVMLNF